MAAPPTCEFVIIHAFFFLTLTSDELLSGCSEGGRSSQKTHQS